MNPAPSIADLAGRLAAWLLPAPCLACKAPISSLRAPLGLCPPCRERLAPLALESACRSCSEPLSQARVWTDPRCEACRERGPSYDRLLAAWLYRPPLDAVIRDFKFRRLDYLGEHLARTMADRLGPVLGEGEGGPALVSHVPLHWRRRLRRGYDQAREIAVPLARALGLPFHPTLRRRRSTSAQSSLDRSERLANLEGVFAVRRSAPVLGRCILLVDDVATTGATLDAAARVLKGRGAATVIGLAAARTPLQREPGAS